jgi:hypothetical protein
MMTALADWRGWRLVSAILATFIALYFAYFAIMRPALDWDVVPYTMAILKAGATSPDGTVDIVALHAKTWTTIRPHPSPAGWTYLTVGNSYVEAQHLDPVALFSQLPLYESKYGYIVLLKGVALAMDPVRAIVMVSLVSTLGILAILVYAAWRLDGIATLAWLPLVLLFGLGSFASMVSPDAVFTFACVAGIALLLSERVRPAVVCFLLAVLLRPDGIVLNAILCGGLALRRQYGAALALFIGSVAAYAMSALASQSIGWWPLFYFTFAELQNVLKDFRPAFDSGLYFKVMMVQIGRVSHMAWLHAALAAVLTAILLLKRQDSGAWANLLLGILLIGAAARFVLFPSVEIRFYAPHVFGIGLIILHALKPRGAAD